jgi:hypothetical protein
VLGGVRAMKREAPKLEECRCRTTGSTPLRNRSKTRSSHEVLFATSSHSRGAENAGVDQRLIAAARLLAGAPVIGNGGVRDLVAITQPQLSQPLDEQHGYRSVGLIHREHATGSPTTLAAGRGI